MARTTREAQSSSGPSRRTRSKQGTQSVVPADLPTQVQKRPRKAPPERTSTPKSKPSKQRAAKKSAGRNALSRLQEEEQEEQDEQEEQQEPEREERQAPTLDLLLTCRSGIQPSMQEQLENAMELLSRYGADEPWVVTSLERHLQNIKEAAREADEDDDEREQTPIPVKHYKTLPKVRRKKPTPWNEVEEAFLVQLVAKEGAKWSSFERRYSHTRLIGRDQTAIKDKARNIMRKIIDQDGEEEFLARCPKWAEVTVGNPRRGVHGYEPGKIPKRKEKAYIDMVE